MWPNAIPIPATYAEEISTLKNWITQRLDWLDKNMPDNGACAAWPETITGTQELSAYRNPFEGNSLKIRLRSKEEQMVSMQVFDMGGRLLDQRHPSLQTGINMVSMNANRWQSGVYYIRFINIAGEQVQTRVVKTNCSTYLCGMQKKSMHDLGRKSVDEFKVASKTPVIIVLDNIRSMHNVGSVFRTADAFLVEAIYLCGFTPIPPHRDIHKTALGATETVTWKYFGSTAEAVVSLKMEGYGVYAIEQVSDSFLLNRLNIEMDEKLAIVFGNEVNGVDAKVIAICNGCIEIPQLGMKHSLNISIAAGIVMWELMRKRI